MSPQDAAAVFLIFGGGFWVIRPVAAAIAKRIAGEHRRPGIELAERDEILDELQRVRAELTDRKSVV